METEEMKDLIAKYEAETDLNEKAIQALHIADLLQNRYHRFNDAQAYLVEALAIAEQTQEDTLIYYCYNSMGELYVDMQKADQAEQAFFKAISIAESLNDDTLLTRPYINLGMLHYNLSNHYLSMDYLETALKLAEKQQDIFLIGMAMFNLARIFMDINEHKKAVNYLRNAFRLLRDQPFQRIACYVNLGISYAHLKDFSLSMGYYKRVIPLLHEVNNHIGVVEMYCRICEGYIYLNKYDKVMQYAQKALKYIEDYNIDTIQLEEHICLLYLRFYSETENIAETEKYIEKFLTFDVKNQEYLYLFYQVAYRFYEYQQKYDLAFSYLLKFHDLEKIIFDEEMNKNLAIRTANLEYEREKQRAELLHQKTEEMLKYQQIIVLKNSELIKMDEEKDNLMNTISHDLKNYLGSAQQALDIYKLKKQEEADNKYIKMVATATDRSLKLVKEILYSTKVSASPDSLSLQTVDMNTIIAENEDVLLLRGNQKGINIVFQYAPEPLMVQIDCEKWHRVFENLTTNAIKFTSSGKDIRISTKREDNYALICVADSGIGIAPENISKLFTPFSGVGRKGTDGEESTGLGLSIVKKLIELHGGSIQVTSEVGRGTEFVVKLVLVNNA